MKYISKGEWFKVGTEVTLIDDYRPGWDAGLFEGLIVLDEEKLRSRNVSGDYLGKEEIDQEICSFDEFEVIDEAT